MGLSLTTFVDGAVISANDIRSRIETIENFVNTGIVAGDLKTSSAWVDYPIIFKPDFYGSPSPRSEMVSGDTWYRFTPDGRENYAIFHADPIVDNWIPIPGLCATVRSPNKVANDAFIMVCFYAFTIAGYNGPNPPAFNASFEQRSGQVSLFVNDVQVSGTLREIYALPHDATSTPAIDSLFGRVNINMVCKTALTQTTNTVAVKIKLDEVTFDGGSSSGNEPDWKHTFIATRNIVVDVPHLQT